MEKGADREKEVKKGHLAFLMVKGDLSQKITNPSEKRMVSWLADSLKEYADEVCGEDMEVLTAKLVGGLNKQELAELYGSDHEKWLEGLTEGDFDKHMAVYDGRMGPLMLAIVRMNGSTSSENAEERLIKVRDSFRVDWYKFLGKKEIKLPGGSSLFLSALHAGNYEESKPLLEKYGLTVKK